MSFDNKSDNESRADALNSSQQSPSHEDLEKEFLSCLRASGPYSAKVAQLSRMILNNFHNGICCIHCNKRTPLLPPEFENSQIIDHPNLDKLKGYSVSTNLEDKELLQNYEEAISTLELLLNKSRKESCAFKEESKDMKEKILSLQNQSSRQLEESNRLIQELQNKLQEFKLKDKERSSLSFNKELTPDSIFIEESSSSSDGSTIFGPKKIKPNQSFKDYFKNKSLQKRSFLEYRDSKLIASSHEESTEAICGYASSASSVLLQSGCGNSFSTPIVNQRRQGHASRPGLLGGGTPPPIGNLGQGRTSLLNSVPTSSTPQQVQLLYPPINMDMIVPFDINCDSRTVKAFFQSFEQCYWNSHGGSSQALAIRLGKSLKGAAKQAYDSVNGATEDYGITKNKLLSILGARENNLKNTCHLEEVHFNKKLGCYGLLAHITSKIVTAGKKHMLMDILDKEFYKRLPSSLASSLAKQTKSNASKYGRITPTYDDLVEAAQTVDQLHDYENSVLSKEDSTLMISKSQGSDDPKGEGGSHESGAKAKHREENKKLECFVCGKNHTYHFCPEIQNKMKYRNPCQSCGLKHTGKCPSPSAAGKDETRPTAAKPSEGKKTKSTGRGDSKLQKKTDSDRTKSPKTKATFWLNDLSKGNNRAFQEKAKKVLRSYEEIKRTPYACFNPKCSNKHHAKNPGDYEKISSSLLSALQQVPAEAEEEKLLEAAKPINEEIAEKEVIRINSPEENNVSLFSGSCFSITGSSDAFLRVPESFAFMMARVRFGDSETYTAVVDSGAQASVIDYRIAKALPFPTSVSQRQVQGLGANAESYSCKTMKIPITVEGKLMKTMSWVIVDGLDLPYSVFLGRDFLGINNLRVDSVRYALHHQARTKFDYTYSLYLSKEGEGDETAFTCEEVPVTACESKTLIPGVSNTLTIGVQDSFQAIQPFGNLTKYASFSIDYVLELDPFIAGRYPYDGLIDRSKKQTINICVDEEVTINEGMPIGRVYSVLKKELKETLSSDPHEAEIVEALNERDEKKVNSPTIVELHPPKNYPPNQPFEEAPAHLRCGSTVRLYEPRDMNEFDREHESYLKNPVPDKFDNPWTLDRIRETFKIEEKFLSEDQYDRFLSILFKYREAFQRDDYDCAIGSLGEAKLELKPGATPVSIKPRRLPPDMAEMVNQKALEYLKHDIIEESSGAWSSPVHIVFRRGSAKPRMVVDFRVVNSHLQDVQRYLEGVDDHLMSIGSKKIFSKVDLSMAYHSLAIASPYRDVTSIILQNRLMRYKVLAFGLSVAVQIFELTMGKIFEGFSKEDLAHYLDDFGMFSDETDHHLKLIESFLRVIVMHRLKISPSKCLFFRSSIEFLGIILSTDGVRKSPEYMARIKDYEKPRTSVEMMRFIGLVNFQRNHIPFASDLTKPLTESICFKNKRKILTWTPEMEQSFEEIKTVLQNDVALALPNFKPDAPPMKLFVDASATALGASLTQPESSGEDAALRIITHSSRTLISAELRYSSLDKELLSLVWGILHHKKYLAGRRFQVYTDCQPIQYLFASKYVCPRMARAYDYVAGFDFEVCYLPGKNNVLGDFLSRLNGTSPVEWQKLLADSLEEASDPEGFCVARVPGGGDSMILSLLKAMRHLTIIAKETFPSDLRSQLVQEILEHPDRYGLKGNPERTKIIRSQRGDGVLTSVECLQSCSNLYDVKIEVYFSISQPLSFYPRTNTNQDFFDDSNTIRLRCSGQGAHYDIYLRVDPTEDLPIVGENTLFVSSMPNDWVLDSCNPTPYKEITERTDVPESYPVVVYENKIKPPPEPTILWHLPSSIGIKDCSCGHQKSDFLYRMDNQILCGSADSASSYSYITDEAISCLLSWGIDCKIDNCVPKCRVQVFGNRFIYTQGEVTARLPLSTGSTITYTFKIMRSKDSQNCILFGSDFIQFADLQTEYFSPDMQKHMKTEEANFELSLDSADDPTRMLTFEFTFRANAKASLATSNPGEIPSVIGLAEVQSSDDSDSEFAEPNDLLAKLSAPDVREMQSRDQNIRKVINFMKRSSSNDCPVKSFERHLKNLSITSQDVLVYRGKVVVASFDFAVEVICQVHENNSHCGRQKLLKAIDQLIWRPGLYSLVTEIIRPCPIDQCSKVNTVNPRPPMHKTKYTVPFGVISIDILSLPKDSQNYSCILVVVDLCSKWLRCYPLKNHKSSTMVSALESYLQSIPRCPLYLLSDNAPDMSSNTFAEFCEEKGIKHLFSSPYAPWTNGACERAVGEITQQLRSFVGDSKDWKKFLSRCVIQHNHTVHASTGRSPASFVFEDPHKLDATEILPRPIYDRWRLGNPNFSGFKKGDEVLVKSHYLGNLSTNKLKPLFKGPYKIVKVRSDGLIYDLKCQADESDLNNIHYEHLRFFHRPIKWLMRSKVFRRYYHSWAQSEFPNDWRKHFSKEEAPSEVSSEDPSDSESSVNGDPGDSSINELVEEEEFQYPIAIVTYGPPDNNHLTDSPSIDTDSFSPGLNDLFHTPTSHYSPPPNQPSPLQPVQITPPPVHIPVRVKTTPRYALRRRVKVSNYPRVQPYILERKRRK